MSNRSTARLVGISGATLALVLAGTAVVSAAPGGQDEQRGFGPFGGGRGLGGGRAFEGGPRGPMPRLGGFADGFVRSETVVQDGDAFVTYRVDDGTATTAIDTSLDYSLANGETASVTVDADTTIVSVSVDSVAGRHGFLRQRMVPKEIAVTDIAAGAEITVWSESQDDGSFLAQRILVRPAETSDSTDSTDATSDAASATDSTTSVPVADA